MIVEEDQVAFFVVGVEASGGIAEEEGPDTQGLQYPNGEGDLLHTIAFIKMEPALQNDDFFVSDVSQDQLSFVEFYGRLGEMRNILVGDLLFDGQLVDEGAQACAQDHSRGGAGKSFGLQKVGGFLNLSENIFHR